MPIYDESQFLKVLIRGRLFWFPPSCSCWWLTLPKRFPLADSWGHLSGWSTRRSWLLSLHTLGDNGGTMSFSPLLSIPACCFLSLSPHHQLVLWTHQISSFLQFWRCHAAENIPPSYPSRDVYESDDNTKKNLINDWSGKKSSQKNWLKS